MGVEKGNSNILGQEKNKSRQKWFAAYSDLHIKSDPLGEIPWSKETNRVEELD